MIAAACEGAEKVLADTRKAYCFGTRQGPAIAPTLDKGQAAKIQEQENLLRAAVNVGEGNSFTRCLIQNVLFIGDVLMLNSLLCFVHIIKSCFSVTG